MRPFERLTPRGRARRLRELAIDALRRYDVGVRRCFLVAESFNAIFGVDADDRRRRILRVGPADPIHADGSAEVEAAWLDELRGDRVLAAPTVIRTATGSVVARATRAGVPGVRSCELLDWMRGRPLRDAMSLDRVRAMGRVSALLHEHASTRAPRPAPNVLVGDRVLYWRNERRLDELEPAYAGLFAEAADRAQRAIDRLWLEPPHPPHLVHGDLVPSNVLISRGAPAVIDFQDLFWGFEVQDVSISVAALEGLGDGVELVRAFERGYAEIRPWPASDPGTVAALIAARRLHQLNLGLNVRKPGLACFVADHAALIGEWMSRPAN